MRQTRREEGGRPDDGAVPRRPTVSRDRRHARAEADEGGQVRDVSGEATGSAERRHPHGDLQDHPPRERERRAHQRRHRETEGRAERDRHQDRREASRDDPDGLQCRAHRHRAGARIDRIEQTGPDRPELPGVTELVGSEQVHGAPEGHDIERDDQQGGAGADGDLGRPPVGVRALAHEPSPPSRVLTAVAISCTWSRSVTLRPRGSRT